MAGTLFDQIIPDTQKEAFHEWYSHYVGAAYDLNDMHTRKFLCLHNVVMFAYMYFSDRLENDFGEFQLDALNEMADLPPGQAVLKLWPREHAKTTLISMIFVTWCIAYRRSSNILIFSDTADQAKEFLRNIKNELESNEKIRRDFGDMVGDAAKNGGVWNVQHIVTANRVQVRAKGGKGQTRGLNATLPKRVYWGGPGAADGVWSRAYLPPDAGDRWPEFYERSGEYYLSLERRNMRPNLVILDDILNDKHVKNEQLREETWRWFWQQLWNAIDHRKGNVVVVGTILHEDDLLNRLYEDVEQTEGWRKTRLPACSEFEPEILGSDFVAIAGQHKGEVVLKAGATRMRPTNVLWKDRWGKVNPATGQYTLWERRREIGELLFAIEFKLEPIDESVRIIRMEWLRRYLPVDVVLAQDQVRALQIQLGYVLQHVPQDLVTCTSVDPAISERESADYTIVSTMGYSPSARKFYLLELTRRRMTTQETVMEIMRHVQKWSVEFGGAARDRFGHVLEKGYAFEHMGVVIEVNAYQRSLYQAFKLMATTLGYTPRVIQRNETRDKRYRFYRMQPFFESGSVYFPLEMVRGYEKPDIATAINETINIGVAAHDDCPDAIERNLSLLSRYAIFEGYEMDARQFLEMATEDGEYVV